MLENRQGETQVWPKVYKHIFNVESSTSAAKTYIEPSPLDTNA